MIPWGSIDEAQRKIDEAQDEAENQAGAADRQADDAASRAHNASRDALRSLRDEPGPDASVAPDQPAPNVSDPGPHFSTDSENLGPSTNESGLDEPCTRDPDSNDVDRPSLVQAPLLAPDAPAQDAPKRCLGTPGPRDDEVRRESRLEDRLGGAGIDAIVIWVIVGTAIAYALAHVAWSLHSRSTPRHALDHPHRLGIVKAVEGRPGIDVSALARQMGFSRSVARHHLSVLARAGMIRLAQIGGRTAVFRPLGGTPTLGAVQAALLQRPPVRRLYDLLQREPRLDQASIAERLGMTQQRVSHLLRRMGDAALVGARSDGRRATYEAQPTPGPDAST